MVRSPFSCVFPSHQSRKSAAKVYPISKFTYPFQQRLRELATPKEVYHAQIADVDETIDFNPIIVPYGPVNYLYYNPKEKDAYVFNDQDEVDITKVDKTKLYNVKREVQLFEVDSSVFQQPFLQQVYANGDLYPRFIKVFNSTIDDTFITEAARTYTHLRNLTFESCQITAPNIFKDIYKLKVGSVDFKNCINLDWINALLSIKHSSMFYIRLIGNVDDVFWNVNVKNFKKLFHQINRNGYHFHVQYCATNGATWFDVRHRLLDIFDLNFCECEKSFVYYDLQIETAEGIRYYIYRKNRFLR